MSGAETLQGRPPLRGLRAAAPGSPVPAGTARSDADSGGVAACKSSAGAQRHAWRLA